jgi:hypothetical protein
MFSIQFPYLKSSEGSIGFNLEASKDFPIGLIKLNQFNFSGISGLLITYALQSRF